MVRFNLISIEFQDGTIRQNRSLAQFNNYRSACWSELAPVEKAAYEHEWHSHCVAEREWEGRYRLPPRSLEGVCLIFGDCETAAAKVRDREAREVLAHPGTIVNVEINEEDQTVYVYVYSGEVSWAPKIFVYSYPVGEILIPYFESMSSSSDSDN